MAPIKPKSTPLSLAIAIPSSFIDIDAKKTQKTEHIGRIGRSAAIFRVDEIIVYLDRKTRKQNENSHLITRILEYMETPQYLRKHLFGKMPELQYAGLLPPLRTAHHPLERRAKRLKTGEIREGYAYLEKGKPVVDLGVEFPLPLQKVHTAKLPMRVTVQITREKPKTLVAYSCDSPPPNVYWGYKVNTPNLLLGEFLINNPKYEFVVSTTRKGDLIPTKGNVLYKKWCTAKRLLLLFGSHKEGLPEILSREGHKISSISDYSINLIPQQGVATVRTEEAVIIGLATFRLLESESKMYKKLN